MIKFSQIYQLNKLSKNKSKTIIKRKKRKLFLKITLIGKKRGVYNMYFEKLVEEFKKINEVEALALGGSRSSDYYDEKSDYDLYVYVTKLPSLEVRKRILEETCRYIELSNSYWELEDDCTLKDDIDIDILYRNLDDFAKNISRVVDDGVASNGYTTCLWHNLKTCKILFDRNGKLEKIKKQYDIKYPDKLKENIIKRNMSLLSGYLPSYDKQIEKALNRFDFISVNHRLAAFIESYFDIIFAVNEITHPGEKRMIFYALKECKILPKDFKRNLDLLLSNTFIDKEIFLDTLQRIIKELQAIINS